MFLDCDAGSLLFVSQNLCSSIPGLSSQVFWPAKDPAYVGQHLFRNSFKRGEGLFNIWEYKSCRPKVRDFPLWWPVSVSVVCIVWCPVDRFSFKRFLLPVVRPASIINILACCVNHFELGWCWGLFCTPTWIMLGFSSSCLGFKHSSELPCSKQGLCKLNILKPNFFRI